MGNHNSGRRPAPTKIKLLRGMTRRDRVNYREPTAPVDPVGMPAGLTAGAVAVWGRMAPVCSAMRTLLAPDVPAFVTFCELQASFDALMITKAAPGFALLKWSEDATGEAILKVHPVLRLERELAASLRAYYEYFGLTPSARSRIVVQSAEAAPVSRWA